MAIEVVLVRTPRGKPVADDFMLVERPAPSPGPGEVLVQSLILSVDPYLRLWMEDPATAGQTVVGSGVARVVASRDPAFHAGDIVRHRAGMRDEATVAAAALTSFEMDPGLPIAVQMNALGGIGLCAYGGLLETGRLRQGEQVFVSAAAGAVGSLAVQVAKLKGCRVVGSAGSAAKVAWLQELGVDAAIDYSAGDLAAAVARATPKGIDVYFDNVGGAHLDAAIPRMNKNGRIPVCGMISAYNDAGASVTQLHRLIMPRVTLKGFGFDEFAHLQTAFRADMLGWLKSGAVRTRETILDGIDAVPEAIIGLFEGRNFGKMLVRVGDDVSR